MYRSFFGLKEWPYRNTPDPRFLYWNPAHEQAFNMLMYALEEHDIVMLTGETGTGKTTLIRAALEEAQKSGKMTLIVLVYPRLTPFQLLKAIAQSLEIDPPRSRLAAMNAIADELLERWRHGEHIALVIDESQLLPGKAVFDEIRLLNNLQLDDANLLGLILVGQPELLRRLKHSAYRAFRQRISMHIQLAPMEPHHVARYLQHRWKIAGGKRLPFTPGAVEKIAEFSQGIPRTVNHLAHLALLEAYGRDEKRIRESLIEDVRQSILV